MDFIEEGLGLDPSILLIFEDGVAESASNVYGRDLAAARLPVLEWDGMLSIGDAKTLTEGHTNSHFTFLFIGYWYRSVLNCLEWKTLYPNEALQLLLLSANFVGGFLPATAPRSASSRKQHLSVKAVLSNDCASDVGGASKHVSVVGLRFKNFNHGVPVRHALAAESLPASLPCARRV